MRTARPGLSALVAALGLAVVGLAVVAVLTLAVPGPSGAAPVPVVAARVPAAGVSAAGVSGAWRAPAQSSECPAVESLGALRPGTEWLAESDLRPVARILAEREAPFRTFPGLGADAGLGTGSGLGADAGPTAPPTRIVLLRDLECLERLGVSAPGIDWVAGLALSGEGLVAIRVEHAAASVPAVAAVLRHELAHVVLHRASAGTAPRWLQEGYAQLASGTWDWGQAWRLRWTFLSGSGDRLREIQLEFPGDADGARLAYQVSYAAVQELWELAGEAGFSAFVQVLAEGDSVDAALQRVFGMTEGQFTERWQRGVASRYGMLYTLSRAAVLWTGISLLFLWAGLRRRRTRREQLERLREADRRDEAREEAIEREAALREDGDHEKGR